jgi:signal transduction histidine kinase
MSLAPPIPSRELNGSGIILHELSNIAAIIRAGAQLMESAHPNFTQASLATRAVVHGSQRLNETLLGLHSLLGGPRDPGQEIDRSLRSFVHEFANDSFLWPQKQELLRVTGDNDEKETFNPEMLRMALRNLVANALRHNFPGAQIDIRIRHSPRESRILVRNFGSPIPDAVKACLFQPGCKGPGSGAGLGLHIAQRCARSLAGSIRYRSTPTQTVFCLVWPTRRPGETSRA